MKYQAPFGSSDPNAPYVDRNTPGAVSGSRVPAPAIEDPQRELVRILTDRGIVPDGDVLDQVSKALMYVPTGRADIPVSGWQAAPPGSPVQWATYVVAASPTGAWAGQATKIAMWTGSAWVFFAPVNGLQVNYNSAGAFTAIWFDGTTWQLLNTRRRLTADTTFYVNGTTGSDANDGSAGAPWATLTKAAAYLRTQLDLNGFTVTVSVANGTYTTGFALSGPLVGQAGITNVQIIGNVANPAACFINNPSTGGAVASNGAAFQIKGFQVSALSSIAQNGSGLYASTGGIISYDNMAFNACFNAQVYAEIGGFCVSSGPNTINGNAPSHIFAKDGGVISIAGRSHTLIGGPTFAGAFAQVEGGTIEAAAATFSGGAAGPRYYANILGAIKVGGGGANFFPGSIVGGTNAGGQYV